MTRLLARLARRRANAIVELALVMPLVAAAAVFVADLGAKTHRNMTLKSAARAGVEYVMRTGDSTGVAAVVAAAANRSTDVLTVTTAQFCTCGTTTATCGATCGEGAQQTHLSVAVSERYIPFIAHTLGGDSETVQLLSAQATFRVR